MPNSKIKPDIIFAESEYVVFLMNIKGTQHAFIVIENNIRMTQYDFVPTASSSEVLLKSISASTSRLTMLGRTVAKKLSVPGSVNIKGLNIDEISKLAEEGQLEYQWWVVNSDRQNALWKSIIKDAKNPPNYGLSGSDAALGSGEENCLTWSTKKLESEGVNIQVTKHWTNYVLVSKPSTVGNTSWNNIPCILI